MLENKTKAKPSKTKQSKSKINNKKPKPSILCVYVLILTKF